MEHLRGFGLFTYRNGGAANPPLRTKENCGDSEIHLSNETGSRLEPNEALGGLPVFLTELSQAERSAGAEAEGIAVPFRVH